MRALILSVLLLLGCHKTQLPIQQQAIRMNIGEEPQSLDPRKARSLTSITLMHMFFEGLMRISQTGALEMALADQVDVSADGLQYRFHLRKSFWSNGKAVTSLDFSEAWRTILDPQFPTDIAYQLYGIKNARKAKLGEVSLAQIGVLTPDLQTLVVELEQPIPYFLELLATPYFFPVPLQIVNTYADWAYAPETYVCNGPFKLDTWKHSEGMKAVKNPHYWQADNVRLKEINLVMVDSSTELQMFEAGNLDWAGSPLSSISVDAVLSLKTHDTFHVNPFLATYFFRVNTSETLQGKKNPLSSSAFRKALAMSLDRKLLTEHILQGGQIPARGLVPPGLGLSDKGYFQDEVNQARAFLTDALLELDLTLDKLEPVRLSFAGSERNAMIAQAIQKQWEKALGIRVELEAVESKIYFQRISHKEYQLAAGSWTADFSDPINFLEVFKYKDASTNNTNWENGRYTDLLNQSALCQDTQERIRLLREAEIILMDQMPLIPVYHYALNYLKRDGLEEVALSPLGKIDFRWAHIESSSD